MEKEWKRYEEKGIDHNRERSQVLDLRISYFGKSERGTRVRMTSARAS